MNEDEQYMFLTEEYADAMEVRNIRKLILLNKVLYEKTFGRYKNLINWKRHPHGLSQQSLENIDNEISMGLKVLENLKEHGSGLSILYPKIFREINLEENK